MSNTNSLQDEKASQEHVEHSTQLGKYEAGQLHHDHAAPPVNDGSFRSPYHYSNDESVRYTHPRGLAYASLILLFAGSQTPLYFIGGSLIYIVPDIGGADIQSWYPVAYAISLAAVCPFTGYLSDIISRRYVAILGQVLNCVGTALIIATRTPAQLIAGSAIAGIGAGIGEMSAQGGMGEMVPRKHRGNISALMIVGILPFAPYVLWANYLGRKHRSGWKAGFWLSISYNLLDLIMLVLFYWPPNEPLPEGVTRKTVLRNIDWLGGFLVISGLVILLYALQNGEQGSWKSAKILAPFFIGIALVVAFFIWETKAALPLIPVQLFKDNPRVLSLTFAITAIAGANFFSLTNFVPLLVSNVFDASNPTRVGLRALPGGLMTTLGAVLFAPPLSRFPNHTRYIMMLATGMMTIFIGTGCITNPDRETFFIVNSLFGGLGVGGVVVPAATIAVIAAPNSLLGTVTSLTLSVRAVGGALGNSIYFNVFYKQFPKAIVAILPERLLEAGLPPTSLLPFIGAFTTGNTAALAEIPGVTPAVIEAATIGMRWVYASALRHVFLISIAFGVAAVIASAFLGNLSEYVNSNEGMHVERTLHTHERPHA